VAAPMNYVDLGFEKAKMGCDERHPWCTEFNRSEDCERLKVKTRHLHLHQSY
jgi:hypothetical protein